MANDESEQVGPRGKSFGPGEGLQLLAQLQATGAKVLGSDGEKVGDLKSVGDADFLVGRTLRRDVRVPIARIEEVTEGGEVVLDVPADRVEELGRDERSRAPEYEEGFSEGDETRKGGLGDTQEGGDKRTVSGRGGALAFGVVALRRIGCVRVVSMYGASAGSERAGAATRCLTEHMPIEQLRAVGPSSIPAGAPPLHLLNSNFADR
ncbi:MAG: hypothetical protein M3Q49_07690 [Actinomycetota bacterium]|nr:hypothetical protein [Actinomycetota bacterium]